MSSFQLNDAAAFAGRKMELAGTKAKFETRDSSEQLSLALRDTLGGQNCIEVGNGTDLPDCAQIDRFQIVPELDVPNWRITVPQSLNTSC